MQLLNGFQVGVVHITFEIAPEEIIAVIHVW
jgi:hypothetical protein